MSPETVPRQRVSVQKESYCFIVMVDAQPVLRCTVRRDAMRYAVLVRQALAKADLLKGDGGVSVQRQRQPRNILH